MSSSTTPAPAASAVTETPPTTVRSLLTVASGWLAEQGVEEARLDTELLLSHALGCKRLDLYLDHDKVVAPEPLQTFRALMRRRGKREPVAYLLGTRGFYGIDVIVAPGVLIPRPETELLVEIGLELCDSRGARPRGAQPRTAPPAGDEVEDAVYELEPDVAVPTGGGEESVYEPEPESTEPPLEVEAEEAAPVRPKKPTKPDGAGLTFADVGTGSGCVALALLAERSALTGIAIDVSPEALAIAAQNVEALGAGERLELRQGNLLDGVPEASLDLVVSNPPYVTRSETDLLSREIREHEPESALFDADDLPLTRTLAQQAFAALKPGGALAIETGFDKAALVATYLREAGFADVDVRPDLSGVERVVLGRKPA